MNTTQMQEIKFDIYGEFIRPNGYQKYDILSYIAETREEAIATCRKNNPHFNIITIQVDDTAPEVVKVQSLIWWTQQLQLIRFKLHNLEGIYPF